MVSVITEVAVVLTVHIRDTGAGSGGGGREGWIVEAVVLDRGGGREGWIVEAVVRAGIRAFQSGARWCR